MNLLKILLIATLLFLVGIFSSTAFGQTFGLDYDIRGGDVTSIDIDDESNSLKILLDTRTRGELVITIPRSLLDAKTNSEERPENNWHMSRHGNSCAHPSA